jgi:hypothetical protein
VCGAAGLFAALHGVGKLFHPEDSAHDIVDVRTGEPLFTAEEAKALDCRMAEAYQLDWGAFECPCGYILTVYPIV